MPRWSDEATWGTPSGHPNDPRTLEDEDDFDKELEDEEEFTKEFGEIYRVQKIRRKPIKDY